MIDVELLKLYQSPYDELIKMFRDNIDITPHLKIHKIEPFTSYVTHSLVTDPAIVKLAKNYIYELFKNKPKYGFLYHLQSKKLIVQLNLHFNGELVIDPQHYHAVIHEIQELALDVSCPPDPIYDITRIELLYFFTLFVNIHLNWITVDHLLGCNKSHGYLAAVKR